MDEIAITKLEMVGLKPDVRDKYPAELSGGMIKRVALARALALDPEVVFLDEPTSGLDPIGAGDFDELIRTLQQTLGLTVYMVTHDLDSLNEICDRIAVLSGGKVIVTGTDGHHARMRASVGEGVLPRQARPRDRRCPSACVSEGRIHGNKSQLRPDRFFHSAGARGRVWVRALVPLQHRDRGPRDLSRRVHRIGRRPAKGLDGRIQRRADWRGRQSAARYARSETGDRDHFGRLQCPDPQGHLRPP